MPRMDGLPIKALYEKYGEPRRETVKRLDNAAVTSEAPTYTVIPVWFGIGCEGVNLEDALVHLSDFGEAFRPDCDTRTVTRVPLLLRPPEANFFDQPLGFPADIWTLACTLYAVLGEGSLFEGRRADVDAVLAENISAIGKLPPDWWAAWAKRDDFYTLEGDPQKGKRVAYAPRSSPISERVDDMGRNGDGGFSSEELADITDMLERMLVFEPANRITAEELTRSAWMEKWGLPALAKAEKSFISTNKQGISTRRDSGHAHDWEKRLGSDALKYSVMPEKDHINNDEHQREVVPVTVKRDTIGDQMCACGERRPVGFQGS